MIKTRLIKRKATEKTMRKINGESYQENFFSRPGAIIVKEVITNPATGCKKKFFKLGSQSNIQGVSINPIYGIAYQIRNALRVWDPTHLNSDVVVKNPDGSIKGTINSVTRIFTPISKR